MGNPSTVGALRVMLGLDAAEYEEGLSRAQAKLQAFGTKMQAVGANLSRVGAGLTVAITAPLIAAGFAASKAAAEAADAMGQVEAALVSMGDASGKTKEDLGGLAEGLMRNSLYDDDDILRSVTANLLTFGKVSGDVFNRAQQAAVDLATRMKMDLQPATLLVGKALNDPIKGLTALGRSGIQFTAAQKDTIKALVATGQTAKAQGMILSELEKQFGGAAAAAQKTDPYDKMRDSLNSISEIAGAIVNRHLAPLLASVASIGDAFLTLDPQMQTFAVAGAAIAAALGPALVVIGSVVGALGTLATALATGGVLAGLGAFAVTAGPFIAAAAAIAAAVYVFRDDLAPIFLAFKDAVMQAVGPAVSSLLANAKAAFAALGPAIQALVGVVGPILAALAKQFFETWGPPILTLLRVLVAGVSSAFSIIAKALNFVTALLTGDWKGAWSAAGSFIMEIMRSIGRLVEAVFPGITDNIRKMVQGVTGWLQGKLFDVLRSVVDKVKWVSDAFFKLYDAVVGHSFVPDMVTEIGQWMAKLDDALVKPAVRATQTAAEAFEGMQERARAAMEGLLTDREQLDLDNRRKMAEYAALLAKGEKGGGWTQAQYDEAVKRQGSRYRTESAGLDADGLKMPDLGNLEDLNTRPFERMQEAWASVQERIRDSRDDFARAFEDGVGAALRGDWVGVLQQIFGDTFSKSLRSLGAKLFDAMGGSSPSGVSLGSVGSALSSIFSKMPRFANEGTIHASGASGIDSQLVSLWKSPREQVSVGRPPEFGDGGRRGSPLHFDMRGAVMTSDLLAQMESMATASGGAIFSSARQVIPSDMAETSRYSFRRGG